LFTDQNGSTSVENPSDDIVGGVILGGDDFVKRIKQEFLHKDSDNNKYLRYDPHLTISNWTLLRLGGV